MSEILIFGKKGAGVTILVYRNVLLVCQNKFLTFEKESVDVTMVYARLDILIVMLLKILLVCDVMPC
jgi:hypothetical protein